MRTSMLPWVTSAKLTLVARKPLSFLKRDLVVALQCERLDIDKLDGKKG